MHFVIKPEVAGGLGPMTKMDYTKAAPTVERLNYEFDGWLGDEVLTSYPCFIVTDRVRSELASLGVTGAEFEAVIITKSQTFEELYPGRSLPKFHWLKVHGRPGIDDIAEIQGELVVSDRVFARLDHCGIKHAEVRPFAEMP